MLKRSTFRQIKRGSIGILILAILIWSFRATEFSLSQLWNGLPQMSVFLKGFTSPDLSIVPRVLKETVLTIQLGIVGTVVATIMALPLSFFAAKNLVANKYIRFIPRLLFNAVRSIDTLIFALVFVVAVGLGPFAGALALSIHSMGMLGKLFYEAIEHIDQGQVTAIKAVGGTKLNVIRWAVLPQVMPFLISYFLYRLELNVRVAVVLGIVGAGGIGQMLYNYINLHRFDRASVVIIIIFLLVMALDAFSSRLRQLAR